MTVQAELHGKLSERVHAPERWEDVLTSSVFGLLRYLEPMSLLLPALREARRLTGERYRPPDGVDEAEFEFWPRLPGGREPDVVIKLLGAGRWVGTVVVEAKFLSGKSNRGCGSEEVEELGPTGVDGDQLCDEARGVALAGYPEPILLYLTAHSAFPYDDVSASQDDLRTFGEAGGLPPILWMGWDAFLRPAEQLVKAASRQQVRYLAQDLANLLARRGFGHFDGFRCTLAKGTFGWTFQRPAASAARWFLDIQSPGLDTWRFGYGR